MSVRKREWTTGKGEARTAWIVDYADGKGVRRLKTFAKKKDADAFAATTHVEVRDGTHVAESATVTVGEAGKLWVASTEKRGLERATVDNYRRHLDLHIVPFIGRDKLSKLNVPSIRAFEDHLRSEGRSSGLVKKVLVALGMLLADAQERGLVARNAVRDIRGRRNGGNSDRHKVKLRVGVDIPSREEIGSLFRAIKDDPRLAKWRPLIVTAALTGMRVSELRGLRWEDVDLDKRQIHIRQRADRFGVIGSPKSQAGRRVISMTPMAANTLREWKLAYPRPVIRRAGGRKPIREEPKPEHLVFPNSKGNVEMLTNILRRGLWPACEAAGLTVQTIKEGKPVVEAKYSMHALRHFHASWCINRPADGGLGLPAKVVQERLGHSTIAMTMDTYGHLFPVSDNTDETEAAERALFV